MNITNCTATFHLFPAKKAFTRPQFLTLCQNGWNTEYNPRRFHSVIMRLRPTIGKTVAALIFTTGRVVLTGVPHPLQAAKMAHRVIRRIRLALGTHQMGVHSLNISNIAAAYTYNKRLAIEKMYAHLKTTNTFDRVQYDPTIFPALRLKSSSMACLLYISGRVIVTGVSTPSQLETFFSTIVEPLLKKFTRE